MKRLALCATALLLAACEPPAPAPAQDARMEALSDQGCTSDNEWCVSAAEGGAAEVRYGAKLVLTLPADETRSVWPSIIRYDADGRQYAVVGFRQYQSVMYSGGGGGVTHVALYVVGSEPTTNPEPAFIAPLQAQLDIRACFSEADAEMRRDICHDQYNFDADIAVESTQALGPPVLSLTTRASTLPPGISRDTDNRRELSSAEMAPGPDANCSYRRTLTYDMNSGQYVPNQPLPDCSQYLEP